MVLEGEDLISTACYQLSLILPQLPNGIREKVDDIYRRLAHPDEILRYEAAIKVKSTMVKHISQLEKEQKEAFARLALNKDHDLFRDINEILKKIKKFTEDHKKSTTLPPNLIDILSRVAVYYENFRDGICRTTGEDRLQRCETQIRIRCFKGYQILKSSAALRFRHFITPSDNTLRAHPSVPYSDLRASHSLLRIPNTPPFNYYKIETRAPSAPPREHAYHALQTIYSPTGSAPTELIFLENETIAIPVQVAKTVNGPILFELLEGRDLLVTSTPPQKNTLKELNVKSNTAYVRVGKELLLVTIGTKEIIPLNVSEQALARFDSLMKVNELADGKSRTLSMQEQEDIIAITGHRLLKSHPDALNKLKRFSHNLHFLTDMVLENNDGHTPNYIAEDPFDENGQLREFDVRGIDNDEISRPAITLDAKGHRVFLKSWALCAQQMYEAFDLEFRTLLLGLPPALVMLLLFKNCLEQDERFLAYKQAAAVDGPFDAIVLLPKLPAGKELKNTTVITQTPKRLYQFDKNGDKKELLSEAELTQLFTEMEAVQVLTTKLQDTESISLMAQLNPIQLNKLCNVIAAKGGQTPSLRALRAKRTDKEFAESGFLLQLMLIPGATQRMYQRLCIIIDTVRSNEQATPHQCALAVNEPVARFYDYLYRKFDNVLDRIAQLYGGRAPTLETLFAGDERLLKQLVPFTARQENLESVATESLPQSFDHFLSTLDFSKEGDATHQGYIVDYLIAHFTGLKNLTLRNCLALNNYRLQEMAKKKNLSSLILINCNQITGDGLIEAQKINPKLEITLQECTLPAYDLYQSIKYCQDLYFQLPNGRFHAKKQAHDLFAAAMLVEQQYTALMTAILLFGLTQEQMTLAPPREASKTMRSDTTPGQTVIAKTPEPILHVAVRRGISAVAENLVQYGMPVDVIYEYEFGPESKREKRRESALDVAIRLYLEAKNSQQPFAATKYQNIILMLIENGALVCNQRNETLVEVFAAFPLRNLSEKRRQGLYIFAYCYNLLTPVMVKHLILEQTTTLSLTPPRGFNLCAFTITAELIEALRTSLPQLKHLDLSGCNGLTADLFSRLMQLPLLSLSINFDQAVQCKLTSLDQIDKANTLKQGQTEIRITGILTNPANLSSGNLVKLCTFIKGAKYLLRLDMAACKIDAAQMTQLALALKENTSLEQVLLNNNPLKDYGIVNLVTALMQHPCLRELALDRVGLGAEGAKKVAELLRTHLTLKVISLQGNSIGDEGALAIAEGLRQRHIVDRTAASLERLDVNECDIIEGAIPLAQALFNCKTLHFLDIGYNRKIGDKGAITLCELLEMNASLLDLRADEIGIADKNLQYQINRLLLTSQQRHRDHVARERFLEISRSIATALAGRELGRLALQPPRRTGSPVLAAASLAQAPKGTLLFSPAITASHSATPPLQVVLAGDEEESSLIDIILEKIAALKAAGYVFNIVCNQQNVSINFSKIPEQKLPLKPLWLAICELLGDAGEEKITQEPNRLLLENLSQQQLDALKTVLKEAQLITEAKTEPKFA